MSLVKVTITIESPGGITSVSRQQQDIAIHAGLSRPLVLPVLLSAVKAAAGPYLDEIEAVRHAVQLLVDIMGTINTNPDSSP